MKRLANNYHLLVLYRLFIILILFAICRSLFIIFNFNLLVPISLTSLIKIFWGGLRFDLSALIYINGFFIIAQLIPFKLRINYKYQTLLFIIFIASNSFAILANCIDLAYFSFTLKRTTADVFSIIGKGYDFLNLLPQFIFDFWYVIILWSVLTFILIYLYKLPLKFKKQTVEIKSAWQYYSTNSLIFIIAIILSFIALRGGSQLRPISLTTAGQYASPRHIPIVLNTPFTIFRTLQYNQIEPVHYFNETQLKHYFNPISEPDTSTFNKKNIVVIILESFSKEYIGSLNKTLDNNTYQGYTPFLDSLIHHSYVMTNCYANGRKSIEAIPAIICGVPSWMTNPFTTSIYATNKINSPATLLKPYGYSSLFFHGGTNGTMGFNDFISSIDFDKYYGRTEYNNDKDYDGNWGIYDEPFLQFMAKKLSGLNGPFISYVFTLSSHHPYTIPTKYSKTFTPTKPEILKTISYTDHALQTFFTEAKKQSWFDNTIFIITSDHTYQSLHPHYQNRVGSYSVPLIIFDPTKKIPTQFNSTTCQQIDILPTIADILNLPSTLKSYGTSIFNKNKPHYSLSYINESWQLIYNQYAYEFDGEKTTSLYYLPNDSLLLNNISNNKNSDYIKAEFLTKSIIQSYNNDLINNSLTSSENTNKRNKKDDK